MTVLAGILLVAAGLNLAFARKHIRARLVFEAAIALMTATVSMGVAGWILWETW